jgi:isopenicillin N synthase-like dioxygenase
VRIPNYIDPAYLIACPADGVFRSAQHRVVSQPGGERYSIPLFFFADFDAPLEVREISLIMKQWMPL